MANKLDTERSNFKPIFLLVWLIMGGVFGLLLGLSQGGSFDQILSMTLGGALASIVYALMGLFIDGVVNHRWRFHQIEYPTWYWYIYPIVAVIAIFIGILVATFKWSSRSRN